MQTEIPVKLSECRKLFGRGKSWMSAIKRAIGVKGNYIFVSQVTDFIRQNPGWTESEVYRYGKTDWKIITKSKGQLSRHSVKSSAPVKQTGPHSVSIGRIQITFADQVVDVV